MTAPEEWFQCDECCGSGVEMRGIWVYETGCAFKHQDTEETPCAKCNGFGGWLDEAVGDPSHASTQTRA